MLHKEVQHSCLRELGQLSADFCGHQVTSPAFGCEGEFRLSNHGLWCSSYPNICSACSLTLICLGP
jgi:hypothetical protein